MNLTGYVVYRQISFLLTPLFLNLSISANAVSLFNLAIAAAVPVLAVFGGANAFLYVALACFIYHCLDYVDGNIARVRNLTSDLGQYLDAFGGKLFWMLAFPSIGVVADHTAPGQLPLANGGLILGMFAALLRLFASESRVVAKASFQDRSPDFSPHQFAKTSRWKTFAAALASMHYLYLPVLLIAGFAGMPFVPLLFVFVYSAIVFLYTQISVFRLLIVEPRFHRKGS